MGCTAYTLGQLVSRALFLPLILSFQHLLAAVEGRPPADPVNCPSSSSSPACTVSNILGIWSDRLPCMVAQVVYPTSEAEVMAAIAAATKKQQKIKVVSKYASSIPKLVCPGDNEGLLVSTRDYVQHLAIDKERMTVVADSGLTLRPLLDAIASEGLALRHSTYWQGVSLSGAISTGAHGSSFFGVGAAIHESVIGIRLVVPASAEEGFVKVLDLTDSETPELLAAVRVSLGVLGFISQVTLRLEPQFKRSITYTVLSDDNLEDQILPFGSEHEFGDIIWNPSGRTASYRADNRVRIEVPGDGVYDFLGFRPLPATLLQSTRLLEEVQEASGNAAATCATAHLQSKTFQALGYGLRTTNTGIEGFFAGYPVVGYNHLLQTSGSCLFTPANDPRICPWDPRILGTFPFITAFSIPVSKVQSFIEDVKTLREMVADSFCGVDFYLGMYLRYVKASSSAYLGEPEDAVSVDVDYFRARKAGRARLLEDVTEEIEQIAVFKYGATPHWGKNRPVAFLGAAAKYPNMAKFLRVKAQLDPDSLFSNDWTDFVLGLEASPQPAALYSTAPGCALEGLCLCSAHVHCAPEQGYLCQPGRVYPEARVCRKVV